MYERLEITPIFNIPYSPQLNPIEACFSQVKRFYKKSRLNCLVNEQEFDQIATITAAFDQIRPCHVTNNAKASLKILDKLNF